MDDGQILEKSEEELTLGHYQASQCASTKKKTLDSLLKAIRRVNWRSAESNPADRSRQVGWTDTVVNANTDAAARFGSLCQMSPEQSLKLLEAVTVLMSLQVPSPRAQSRTGLRAEQLRAALGFHPTALRDIPAQLMGLELDSGDPESMCSVAYLATLATRRACETHEAIKRCERELSPSLRPLSVQAGCTQSTNAGSSRNTGSQAIIALYLEEARRPSEYDVKKTLKDLLKHVAEAGRKAPPYARA
uniref:WAPL domain-containing protein n=1 Tax=Macrostomum lignano TaxID=282301 RepID=A0A1I8F9V9_9PLAT